MTSLLDAVFTDGTSNVQPFSSPRTEDGELLDAYSHTVIGTSERVSPSVTGAVSISKFTRPQERSVRL